MNDEEIAQLQNDDEWDFESAERQRAPRGHRAVVSVGFKTADFTLVAEAARKRDQPLSQFIREAAVDRARGRDAQVTAVQIRSINIHADYAHLEARLLDAIKSRGRLSSLR
jgi:uncharacterized protein (DUF1778 family)